MSLSAFALVMATIEFLVGLPLLVAPGRTTDCLTRLTENDLLYRVVGAAFLMICVVVLAEGPVPDWSLGGFIRLLAWIGAIKCLVICWWPGWHHKLVRSVLTTAIRQRAFGALATAAGVFLFWVSCVL